VNKIIIEQRGDDFAAHLEGNRGIWGSGKTPDSAIGNMVRAHPEYFHIASVEFPERPE
jgi:hypothetical protein